MTFIIYTIDLSAAGKANPLNSINKQKSTEILYQLLPFGQVLNPRGGLILPRADLVHSNDYVPKRTARRDNDFNLYVILAYQVRR